MPLIPERVRRWPRPWRVALLSLLALYALYLIAGNVFLNTPLFDAVTNRKPEKFSMQTGPALTLLPGHARACAPQAQTPASPNQATSAWSRL